MLRTNRRGEQAVSVVINQMKGLLDRVGLRTPLGMLRQTAQNPRWARLQLDILRDYQAFQRQYGHILNMTCDAPDGHKKVLIVSLSDWPYQAKLEGILAKALQLRGYTPMVVLSKGCWSAQRYFRIFGIDEFVFFEDFMSHAGSLSQDGYAEDPLGREVQARSLMNLTYRGVDVGRHALSTVVRRLQLGSVDLSDSVIATAVEHALRRSREVTLASERLVESIQPQMALFLEKGYTPYGELFDVLLNNNVNIIQWNRGHRSDALVLTRYDRETRFRHPLSLSSHTWQEIREMPWTDEHERELMEELRGGYEKGTWFERNFLGVERRIKSPSEVRQQLGLDSSKKTAVIFSHVLWDASFFYGENLFDDHEEWLVETVRAACKNPSVNWVIKLHPDYVQKLRMAKLHEEVRDQVAIRAKVGTLPDHVKLLEPTTDINTFSLFSITDYCLTVRGTIGIEMPCFGIPVFTAGTGRYSGFGFTIDSSTREEYLDKLRHIQDFPRLSPQQTERAKKHAYALLKLRPWAFSTFEATRVSREKLWHPLDDQIVIKANSFRDILHAQDLRAFAEWACESRDLDFLVPSSRSAIAK